MRIGSLTSVNIEQWTPQYQRTTVQKQVPGFIVAQTYDVLARNNVLTIRGYLSGSSASDLATKAMTLRGYVTQKKVVWIDASDQYQGYCELVRILELDGPNLEASKGVLTADFTLKCAMLLPWGTTFTNPFRQTGIVLRDLNGQGSEYMLNPLEMNCNFQINNPDTSSESFSWEFILDNQNAFTNATSNQLADCTALGTGTASATNPIATNAPFASHWAALGTLSIDTAHPENLSGALLGSKSSPSGGQGYAIGYNFGSSGIDLTDYDRLRVWYACSQAGQSEYAIVAMDINGDYQYYDFSLEGVNTWQNLEFSISKYTGNSGTAPDLTKIQYIIALVATAASPPGSINLWLGDIRAEVGYINHCFDTSGWDTTGGSTTFVNDTTIYKTSLQLSTYTAENWNASLKATQTSNSGGATGILFPLPVGSWDFSSYDFIVIWMRSDFGGNSTGTLVVGLYETSYSNEFTWSFPNCNANQWYRLVCPLRNPTYTQGTPSLSALNHLLIETTVGAHSASTNIWLDEIAADVGNPIILECMAPDNIAQKTTALAAYTWTGSAYSQFSTTDPQGSGAGTPNVTNYLDGTTGSEIWGGGMGFLYMNVYSSGNINNVASYNFNLAKGWSGSPFYNTNPTFQPLWGTNTRWLIAIRVPPATSDSLSGNLPSNDLSGFQAISKARLKVLV